MSFLPWLTIGANLLGGFLGDNKGTTTSGTTDSSTTSSGETAQTSSQVAETKGTTTQNGTQNQQSTTNQNQNQQTRTDSFGNQISEQLAESINNSTGQQVGAVNRLDDATKSMLTQQVQSMLQSAAGTNDAMMQEVARIQATDPNFDADAYVRGVMGAANADVLAGVESDVGRMRDESGVSGASNSAAKLLESRTVNDARATLGGIQANASAEAAKLKTQQSESRAQQLVAATTGANNNIQSLLGSLLNAGQTETTTNTQTQTGSQSTKGNTAETSGTTGNTNTQTAGSTDSKAQNAQTETTDQKQKQVGTTAQTSSEKSNTKGSTTGKANESSGGGFGGLLKAFQGMVSADW